MSDDGELALNCPFCKAPDSKCYRTVRGPGVTTRYRNCLSCCRPFITDERFRTNDIVTLDRTYDIKSVSSDNNKNTDTQCQNAHIATPRPRGNQQEEHPGFDQAWQLYLKKRKKKAAQSAWNKAKPPLDKVIAALKWQYKQQDWLKEEYRYAPDFATYINGERWEDEPPRPTATNGYSAPTLRVPPRPKTDAELLIEEADRKRRERSSQ